MTDAPAEVADQKRMELLVEAVRAVSKVLAVGGGGGPRQRLEPVARSLGVAVEVLTPNTPAGAETAIRRAISEGANGLLVRQGGASIGNAELILSHAL